MEAKIVNVVVVTEGGERTYYTTEGIPIGKEEAKSEPKKKRAGGVIKALTPKEAERAKRKKDERELTLENRIKYEKDKNT